MKFTNTYVHLPERFFAYSQPALFPAAQLITLNRQLAQELGFEIDKYSSEELALIFSGQKVLEGTQFISLAYAGHQFGHFNPSLGDGRAILIGEVTTEKKRYDIQLKGAGPTRFSRRGDGKSALGPVIREYILSEAMHRLGVPTTRALAAVTTGEEVYRDQATAGGIFTRVAAGLTRIGSFEYFAARGDQEGVRTLLNYCIDRHYPSLDAFSFFEAVANAQINLVAQWMSLGFIHGVMNTDNMSISGETIDYGPCAFMDHFNFNQVYSFIDRDGRYAYINQPQILIWNLSRLANCLIPFVDENEKMAVEKLNKALSAGQVLFKEKFNQLMARKLALQDLSPMEAAPIVEKWMEYLQNEELDFTLAFRNLSKLVTGKKNTDDQFYKETPLFYDFLSEWQKHQRADRIDSLNQVNPLYIPRNHQVERAIKAALLGDYSVFEEMNQLLQNPFVEQTGFEKYALPPQNHEKIKNTFCGT